VYATSPAQYRLVSSVEVCAQLEDSSVLISRGQMASNLDHNAVFKPDGPGTWLVC
jgi:hypothetical protein